MFEYDALTAEGKAMTGIFEAPSSEDASARLAGMGLNIQAIRKASPPTPPTRIGRAEFLLFNQQLASITRSGLPLERGLRELAADMESPSMKRLLTEVASELEAGATIDQVFEKRKSSVPPLYGRILQAGLKSGRLSEMLTSLYRHLEMAGRTRRILFEALTYPAVILTLAAILLTFFFQVLLPRYSELYDGLNRPAPLFTQGALAVSRHVVLIWSIIGVLVAAVALASVILSRFAGGRRFKERRLIGLPVLGRIYHLGTLGRLADAMATLVGAGTDMPTCLRLGSAATGSELLKQQCESAAREVEGGCDIQTAGESCRYVPGMFFFSMQQGSQRNELQDNLYSLSEMYSLQAQMSQSRLQALLMPVMLVFLGVVVGFTILSMFLPMIGMIQAFQANG
jgi:type II secretory pathway component PulF